MKKDFKSSLPSVHRHAETDCDWRTVFFRKLDYKVQSWKGFKVHIKYKRLYLAISIYYQSTSINYGSKYLSLRFDILTKKNCIVRNFLIQLKPLPLKYLINHMIYEQTLFRSK